MTLLPRRAPAPTIAPGKTHVPPPISALGDSIAVGWMTAMNSKPSSRTDSKTLRRRELSPTAPTPRKAWRTPPRASPASISSPPSTGTPSTWRPFIAGSASRRPTISTSSRPCNDSSSILAWPPAPIPMARIVRLAYVLASGPSDREPLVQKLGPDLERGEHADDPLPRVPVAVWIAGAARTRDECLVGQRAHHGVADGVS